LCVNACSVHNASSDQTKINRLTFEALYYIVSNKCLKHDTFGDKSIQNIISVSKDFVLKVSHQDSAENLDLSKFLNKELMLTSKIDTFHLDNWSNKNVIMSDWSDIIVGSDFQYVLSKKIDGSQKYRSICSYVFSKPYIIELSNENQILYKVMSYYDAPIEYCYVLIKSNKDFKIKSIQCHKEKIKIIPKPPASRSH
jgi:hypothetical protein